MFSFDNISEDEFCIQQTIDMEDYHLFLGDEHLCMPQSHMDILELTSFPYITYWIQYDLISV